MTNLKQRGSRFIHRTAEQGDAIEVEIYYSKGGPNYFSGGVDGRGVYASIKPIELKGGCVSFALTSGIRALVLPLKRKSDKKIAEVAAKIDSAIPKAVELFSSDKHGAARHLRDAA